jgi:hypothetical protein
MGSTSTARSTSTTTVKVKAQVDVKWAMRLRQARVPLFDTSWLVEPGQLRTRPSSLDIVRSSAGGNS